MGLITPTEEPASCPACVGDLPANLNGSIDHPILGFKAFVYVRDLLDPSWYEATLVPPLGPIQKCFLSWCNVDDRLEILVGAAMDHAWLNGNNCDLPAEGTTELGVFCKVWE